MVSKSPSSAGDPPGFKKAGAIIHGDLLKARRLPGEKQDILMPHKHALIVPYTQGRFYDERHHYLTAHRGEDGVLRDDMKYYGLPKGGIDAGETVLEAAIRETREETGIDLNLLFCGTQQEVDAYHADAQCLPATMRRFMRGEVVQQFESRGYPGVRVVHADPVPYDHTYYSRSSLPTRMAMFDIEVDGLEQLKDYLKNQDNIDIPFPGFKNDNRVETTVDQMIDQANTESALDHTMKYLPFDTYLGWLRLGAIPPDGLQFDDKHRDARHETMYQLLDGQKQKRFSSDGSAHQEWFLQLEHDYAPGGAIHSRGDWQVFCREIPSSEYSKLRHCFKAIKEYAKGRNSLSSDIDIIKMDDKDSPLFYYQEGADIVSFERFFSHVGIMAEVNNDYRRAFTGDCEVLRNVARPEQIIQSQVAGVAAFADARDIKRGIQRLRATVGDRIPELKRTARHDPNFDWEKPLLKVRDVQHQRHNAAVEQAENNLGSLRA